MTLALAVVLEAMPGPARAGPGDQFGGDEAGCVPVTRDHLLCGARASGAVAKLRRDVMRCHAEQADARFVEVILGGFRPFD